MYGGDVRKGKANLETNMGLIQDYYALQSGCVASTIKQLEATIEQMWTKTEMPVERIQTLLENLKEVVIQMISDRLQRGWEDWSTQVVELHIFQTGQENRRKEVHGFYKLDKDSVSIIQANLVGNYKVPTERHSRK